VRMAVLLNHQLTGEQKENACKDLNIDEFVLMPKEIADIWSNSDPSDCSVLAYIKKVIGWLEESTSLGDYVIVQGDYGLTFAVVDWCLDNGRKAVYATTERIAKESRDENIIKVQREFRFVRFREYQRPEKLRK
jgi:hypothetical protein